MLENIANISAFFAGNVETSQCGVSTGRWRKNWFQFISTDGENPSFKRHLNVVQTVKKSRSEGIISLLSGYYSRSASDGCRAEGQKVFTECGGCWIVRKRCQFVRRNKLVPCFFWMGCWKPVILQLEKGRGVCHRTKQHEKRNWHHLSFLPRFRPFVKTQ